MGRVTDTELVTVSPTSAVIVPTTSMVAEPPFCKSTVISIGPSPVSWEHPFCIAGDDFIELETVHDQRGGGSVTVEGKLSFTPIPLASEGPSFCTVII